MDKHFRKNEIRTLRGGIKMLDRAISDPGTSSQERAALRTYRRANGLYLMSLEVQGRWDDNVGSSPTVLSESAADVERQRIQRLRRAKELQYRLDTLKDRRGKAVSAFNRDIERLANRINELTNERP